jgi:OmpA-OmpF porin, OOP family
MKKYLLISFLIIFTVAIQAQNLVPNSSFEVYTSCPDNASQIDRATGWSSYYNTPDYFNICSSNNSSSAPSNIAGFQHPATGNGFAGLVIRGASELGAEPREYIGCQLVSPLIIGKKYNISYKVSLCAIDSLMGYQCASNNIGVVFSSIPYSFSNPYSPQNYSTFNYTSIVNDTLNWTAISGNFIADSAYSYLILGNFYDDISTSLQYFFDSTSYKFAYYFFDDILVEEDTLTGIEAFGDNESIAIYPNPSTNFIKIEWKGNSNEPIEIYLIDYWGRIMLNEKMLHETKINIENIESGIYTLLLKQNGINYYKRVLKQ